MMTKGDREAKQIRRIVMTVAFLVNGLAVGRFALGLGHPAWDDCLA